MMTIIFNFYDYDLWFNISRNIQGQEHAIEHLETSDTLPVSQTLGFLLGELTPRKDEDDLKSSKIAKKDENISAKRKSSLTDSVSSLWKRKHEQMSFQGIDGALKIDERVVTFINDSPARGTVRYIGGENDSTENIYIIVGLELVGNCNFSLNCTCLCGCRVPLKRYRVQGTYRIFMSTSKPCFTLYDKKDLRRGVTGTPGPPHP